MGGACLGFRIPCGDGLVAEGDIGRRALAGLGMGRGIVNARAAQRSGQAGIGAELIEQGGLKGQSVFHRSSQRQVRKRPRPSVSKTARMSNWRLPTVKR